MKKKTVRDTLEKRSDDTGTWYRDGYWILAINNLVTETTCVGGYSACRQCIVYIPVTVKSISVDFRCYRYRSYSDTIVYKPEYELSPYILMASGKTELDWWLAGGVASISILPDEEIISKYPKHIMKLVGETTDTYTKFGDSDFPKSVSFNVTTNLCRMTI